MIAIRYDQDISLQELRHSDYQLSDGQPDITGWCICNAQTEKIGTVHDLLFDSAARKVRYLIADRSDEAGVKGVNLVLIPIGMAELHATRNEVALPGAGIYF
ncbi:MAG: PRC-barrel domain-containing protein [Chitinophagaceae bacterium]|nr:PRC-barrel domain-containing protein [Chitinophagaceae bacterium]